MNRAPRHLRKGQSDWHALRQPAGSRSVPALPPKATMKTTVLLISLVLAVANAPAIRGQANRVATGLAMQAARADMIKAKGKKTFYPADKWNLSDLPAYHPDEHVSGTIRIWGSNYITDGNLGRYWVEAFHKYQPDVRFEFHMKTTRAAVPSLVFGVSDLGIGRKITTEELQLYQRYKDHSPLEISIATGSYNVTGWQPAFGIVVNKNNPLTEITMGQLDGIFGAERTGGWVGTDWHPEFARGPDKNIRTWGQLGLKGDWADKEITPYGLNLRYHQATEISDWILKGSDKWNERLRIYANYVSPNGKLSRSLRADLAEDRYGIAYIAAPTLNLPADLKILKVARKPGGPYYAYTIDNIRARRYPLFDQIYAYADAKDARPLEPKVREFLRFVVSRQGQECVERDGKYLPLTAAVSRKQLAKLQ